MAHDPKNPDVRMEAIPVEETIEDLKKRLRLAIVDYRLALADPGYPGGANIQAYLNPNFAAKARRVNALVVELKAIDPAFTADWTPLPEGR